MIKKLLSLLLFFAISLTSNSQIVYVKHDAAGLNNGTNWENAFTDLSTAINSTTSGQIWVAQGTYKPTTDLNGLIPSDPIQNSFKLKLNIGIYGGFSGVETNLNQRNWMLYPTILSGEIGDENEYNDNVLHVISCEYVKLTPNTILDGLTIKGGYAKNTNGGGIYVDQTTDGSFKIKNCLIEENYAVGEGGGLYVFNSDPIIENCIFRKNKAYRGGGMYLWYSDAEISNCEIYDNIADNFPTGGSSALYAGGIYIGSYSSPRIHNNSITNNFAKHEGGAFVNDSNYEVVFSNNTVSSNQSQDGGALFLGWTTYCFNNLFFGNKATRYGGAIYMDYDPNRSQFINNTVVQNSAKLEGGGLYIDGANTDVINSIFYDNSSPIGPQIKTINVYGDWAPDFRFSNIQGGLENLSTRGNNPIVYQDNINVDPLFIDPDNNNFNLQATSPMINAGINNLTFIPISWKGVNGRIINFPGTDLNGSLRIVDNIDIGAYETASSLGIHEKEKFAFVLYPNPSNGYFNISSNTDYDSFSVYNILGTELLNKPIEKTMTKIDLTNYPSGVYFVHFLKDNKKYICKIVNYK